MYVVNLYEENISEVADVLFDATSDEGFKGKGLKFLSQKRGDSVSFFS